MFFTKHYSYSTNLKKTKYLIEVVFNNHVRKEMKGQWGKLNFIFFKLS